MASSHRLRVLRVPGRFAVCRLSASDAVPSWANGPGFVSITRTDDELSIVCAEAVVPRGTACLRGYAAMRVEGTLAPELVGILVSLAKPLADAGIPILAIGTHDTDYVLVREVDLDRAVAALQRAGHEVDNDQGITFPAKRVN
ncbi:MAG TPA: ACT domain-containing protein [Gemmatimonadaceae bacterium]|jgi:hypothetical protein|nr:ACT domain-containing protein [Gemmatimonadaceae bacterium]